MTSLVQRVDEEGGRWVRLVLNAPRGNLLSLRMVHDLDAALVSLQEPGHASVRWVTIEGTGGEFSFGAALQEHLPELMPEVLPATHRMVRRWLALPVPTAALVDGRCLGGGFELALGCDDILATPGATFGLPEVHVGAFPPVGAVLLPLKVGAARASRAIVAGEAQPATYWHEAGLVSLIAPGEALVEAARHWFSTRLARHSAVALGHAALAARTVATQAVTTCLPALEHRYLAGLLQSHDAGEGVRAWLDKRPPRWEDR